MITGCDRNLVNCVNNIAQINTDCGPHPQLSPGGKKHENHHMSKSYTTIPSVMSLQMHQSQRFSVLCKFVGYVLGLFNVWSQLKQLTVFKICRFLSCIAATQVRIWSDEVITNTLAPTPLAHLRDLPHRFNNAPEPVLLFYPFNQPQSCPCAVGCFKQFF